MRNDETLNQEENVQRSGMTAVNVVCAFCVVAYVVAAVFVFFNSFSDPNFSSAVELMKAIRSSMEESLEDWWLQVFCFLRLSLKLACGCWGALCVGF